VGSSFQISSTAHPSFGKIATGPDGNLWIAEQTDDTLDASTIFVGTLAGAATTVTLPTPAAAPFGVAAGPDGNVWVAESGQDQIARVTPGGTITELPIPGASTRNRVYPMDIVAGPDGNLWFTENTANAIGRITPSGSITTYPTAGRTQDVCVGPDGSIWFTEYYPLDPQIYYLGRITRDGTITEYVVPTFANAITAGPDGNIWFTEPAAASIGRFITP
jgi:virginiamycin B lyase